MSNRSDFNDDEKAIWTAAFGAAFVQPSGSGMHAWDAADSAVRAYRALFAHVLKDPNGSRRP